MRSLRVLIVIAGIVGCLTWHAMFFWHYFELAEWWRQNIP